MGYIYGLRAFETLNPCVFQLHSDFGRFAVIQKSSRLPEPWGVHPCFGARAMGGAMTMPLCLFLAEFGSSKNLSRGCS